MLSKTTAATRDYNTLSRSKYLLFVSQKWTAKSNRLKGNKSWNTYLLRFTEDSSTFIYTFSGSSAIAISTNLRKNPGSSFSEFRVTLTAENWAKRPFIPEVISVGKEHFLLGHTLVLSLPPFLMTSNSRGRLGKVKRNYSIRDRQSYHQNECFKDLQTVVPTWANNSKFPYLLNSVFALSYRPDLLAKRRTLRFTIGAISHACDISILYKTL